MLDGVLEREDTSLALSLVSHVRVLLSHTDHHALVTGAAHDGREDGTGCVVAGKTGFAQAGAVVDYQRLNIFVTHCSRLYHSNSEETLENYLVQWELAHFITLARMRSEGYGSRLSVHG